MGSRTSRPARPDPTRGWALVVAYRDPISRRATSRSTTASNAWPPATPTIDIPVSGFETPLAGPVHTTLGVVTYEGDRGLMGDFAGSNATDADRRGQPATNFFNSTISYHGAR